MTSSTPSQDTQTVSDPVSQSEPQELPCILMIDDEVAITDSLGYSLRAAGFRTIAAATLGEADQILRAQRDRLRLVILDLTLPDGHGFDWLKRLRTTSHLPVIILSSHDDEIEHIVGLEIGADDFIDKPFSPREVVARVRALLRRVELLSSEGSAEPAHSATSSNIQEVSQDQDFSQGVWIDYERYRVLYQGESLSLSQQEFALFDALCGGAGRVFTRASLLRAAWGGGVSVSERTVDVHITSLRRKWSDHCQDELIETVRGVGYRLSDSAPHIHFYGTKPS